LGKITHWGDILGCGNEGVGILYQLLMSDFGWISRIVHGVGGVRWVGGWPDMGVVLDWASLLIAYDTSPEVNPLTTMTRSVNRPNSHKIKFLPGAHF